MNDDLAATSRIALPSCPIERQAGSVAVWSQAISIDTYLPEDPSIYPAFLENRVYQGSSGRVFPLPFHERISQQKAPHLWQAVHLENDWLRLVILPELGGRIHIAFDKVAQYDIFYRNNVIKPALVGLAGPWVSGGVEFNWPQHHRPATFLPTDISIEHEADGSATVWCSDHDPFARMKGMHGIRLSPTSSKIEARVRLYNRSETQETFLWWANVAAAVNDDYQSFFPPDVRHVADHAKRAVVTFPRPDAPYYGIDYANRVDSAHPDSDRLDWYRNITVPTSYMVTSTRNNFFGGYDHGRDAGFIHWADRGISPGKKQWTWGNAPFGWAWDSNLTDDDGPYVELMAGVFTDNQPDFAYLNPGETKTFSQYWYPISKIGPAHHATKDIAARMDREEGEARIGIISSDIFPGARIRLVSSTGTVLLDEYVDLSPDGPISRLVSGIVQTEDDELTLTVSTTAGVIFRLASRDDTTEEVRPEAAVEPPIPSEVLSIDELVGIATYLEQYRHATLSPEPYWEEILDRDNNESRATAALGARAYARADYAAAIELLKRSVKRRTNWAPTPRDGEAHYLLGIALSRAGRPLEAVDALSRAAWDAAYTCSAHLALARIGAKAGDLDKATASLSLVLDNDPNNLQAADLLAVILQESGREDEAASLLQRTLQRDPLDQWALHINGGVTTLDATIMLDVALEYASAGFVKRALRALSDAEALLPRLPRGQINVGPLIRYHRAALLLGENREIEAVSVIDSIMLMDSRFAFPSRLDDVDALTMVLAYRPKEALAATMLGHWLYDHHRYQDAIASWHRATIVDPFAKSSVVAHRNLGIASYNILKDCAAAERHYRQALRMAPDDAKLWAEFDQLCARMKMPSPDRLEQLERRRETVAERDDLTAAFAGLLTDVGRSEESREVLACRQFQPWEGGEGQVLLAWDRASLAIAESSLRDGNAETAIEMIESALLPPNSLGESRHPLANTSELHLALGDAWRATDNLVTASANWRLASQSIGDFSNMSPSSYSAQTCFAITALHRLGQHEKADELAQALAAWVEEKFQTRARVDFFATSLPSMLLFIDDPNIERDYEVSMVREQLASITAARRGDQPLSCRR